MRGNLGSRMAAAFTAELESGCPVVILGTDSPTLPPARVNEAFERLKSTPAVIGPACDGGYYLLGLNGGIPANIFASDIEWGGSDVLLKTLDRLSAAGAFHLLDFWYDVDRPDDLRLLRFHLEQAKRCGVPVPGCTAALLAGEGAGW